MPRPSSPGKRVRPPSPRGEHSAEERRRASPGPPGRRMNASRGQPLDASQGSPIDFDTGPLQRMLTDPNLSLLADDDVTSKTDRLRQRVQQLTQQLDAARDASVRDWRWPSSIMRHLLVAAAAFGGFIMFSQMRAQSAVTAQLADEARDLTGKLATSKSEMDELVATQDALATANQRLGDALKDVSERLAHASSALATHAYMEGLAVENQHLGAALKDATDKLAEANLGNELLRRECVTRSSSLAAAEAPIEESHRPGGLLTHAMGWLMPGSEQTDPTQTQAPDVPTHRPRAKRRGRTK